MILLQGHNAVYTKLRGVCPTGIGIGWGPRTFKKDLNSSLQLEMSYAICPTRLSVLTQSRLLCSVMVAMLFIEYPMLIPTSGLSHLIPVTYCCTTNYLQSWWYKTTIFLCSWALQIINLYRTEQESLFMVHGIWVISWKDSKAGGDSGIIWRHLYVHVWRLKLAIGWGLLCGFWLEHLLFFSMRPGFPHSVVTG